MANQLVIDAIVAGVSQIGLVVPEVPQPVLEVGQHFPGRLPGSFLEATGRVLV